MITRAFFFKLTLLYALSICIIAARRLEPSFNDIEQTEFAQQLQHALQMISRQKDDLSGPTKQPQASACSSPSSKWLKSIIADISAQDLTTFFDNHLHILTFVYKLHIAPRQYDQEYFGLDGEYTQEIRSVHYQAQEFWSQDSGIEDEIYLLSAHGSDLADRHGKLVPTLELLFHSTYDSDYTVYDHATDIQELINRLPGGYNFPLLTFNAFATDEMDDANEDSSIIIGDGYFQFQQALGMDSEGPEYAHAHEFSHHLQFLLGSVPDTNKSEVVQGIKKSELLADAFSAYFLAHDQGGNMASDEISNVHSAAFSVGDCVKGSVGHHGTPIQRRCATVWGAALAENDEEEIDKMDLFEFQDRFDKWYERVDDLSESCQHVHSSATSRPYQILFLQVVTFVVGGLSVLV